MGNISLKRRSVFFSSIISQAMAIAAGCFVPSQASATFIDTSTTSGKYEYSFTDSVAGTVLVASGIGNAAHLDLIGPFPNTPSKLGIDYSSVVKIGGSFDFLHNLQCVGFCSARVDTIVQTEITNLGSDPLSVRYETQITPGHLGYVGIEQDTRAAFSVRIFEGGDPNVPTNLYDMAGEINGLGFNEIWGTGTPFTGLTFKEVGLQRAFNWGATDLSLSLSPIGAGETRLVSFMTSTLVQVTGICASTEGCVIDGAQVAFGDPRNNGGGTNALFAIDQDFSPFATYIRVVGVNPLPAVPEPVTWAMMVIGFAVAGGALRHRGLLSRATS